MSCTPFNVQRIKLTIAELNFAKVGKTYNYLVFFTNLQSFVKIDFQKKNKSWTQMQTQAFHPQTFHKLHVQMIFNNQQGHILEKQFLLHMILLERIFGSKKFDNCIARWIVSFFGRLSFYFSFQWTIYFLFKHFCNNRMVYTHIVFQCCYSICYIIYDQTFLCLSFRVFHIKFFLSFTKKPNIKSFYHVTSKLFFEYSIF